MGESSERQERERAQDATAAGGSTHPAGNEPRSQGADGARGQPTGQRQQRRQGQRQAHQQGQPESRRERGATQRAGGTSASGLLAAYGITRIAAIGGGVLAIVALLMPWVEAKLGGQSWDAMATPFGPAVAVAAVLAIVFAVASWGRGWGWLTTVLTGVAGAAIAVIAFVFRTAVSDDDPFGTVEVDGQDVSLAAVEAGTGPDIAILAGGVIVLAAVAGLVSALTRL